MEKVAKNVSDQIDTDKSYMISNFQAVLISFF